MHPQIYLGQIPATSAERRALRALAIDARARIEAARSDVPTVLLLHFVPNLDLAPVDLLLLQPNAAIVGAVRSYRGPIVAQPNGHWVYRDTNTPITETDGSTPIHYVAMQRDAVRARLQSVDPALPGVSYDAPAFERMVGAVVCTPITHPDTQISLAIADHRRQLKVLGLDELPAVATMLRPAAALPAEALPTIATNIFGGRLWHDGTRFLFDLAPARFQLRVLPTETRAERVLPLMEGDNLIGRRRAPQHHEYRLTLAGDELISADHALLAVGDDDQIVVRDTSKNGTWMTPPGAAEERIRRERTITPGTELRMGITRLRLEPIVAPEEATNQP
ncbi:MAG TPA: FHA domain-containing protein [Kouleothrix sp.]|nr:FHA domain-containing protein [Kouleothrix sp.]